MTDEQTMKAGDDPKDFTVDQVNAYLAGDDVDEAERRRVLEAEKDGEGRVGILDGPHGYADSEGGLKGGEPTEGAKVTETKAETFDQAAARHTEAQGEKYQKGYDGFVPSRDGDNPVDLTLAAVTKDA